MRISIDIDDTLVLRDHQATPEKGKFPAFIHRWFGEPLRSGTCALVHELRRRGCSVWIYTSSVRGPFQIRLWLFLYGIRVDGVINDDTHRRELSRRNFSRSPSKYPPAFDIDLHIDDSAGVKMEGDELGFRVLVIQPDDAFMDAVKRFGNADDQIVQMLQALTPDSSKFETIMGSLKSKNKQPWPDAQPATRFGRQSPRAATTTGLPCRPPPPASDR